MELKEAVRTYRNYTAYLKEYKKQHFPVHSVVFVTSPAYSGFGRVAPEGEDVPPDKLAVKLQNENVWWYALENCSKPSNSFNLPMWLKD
jgi:hypothetical protein